MNKKFISGMILLLIGLTLGGAGMYVASQSLGAGLLYLNSWYGQMLGGKVYLFTGPVMLLVGVILALIGYFKACRNYVAPERKPKVKKEKAPKTAPAVPVQNRVTAPVAKPVVPVPNPVVKTENKVAAKASPLDATQISYTFCGKCGKRNKTGAKFCSGCGEKF